jgi:hypothetical protein
MMRLLRVTNVSRIKAARLRGRSWPPRIGIRLDIDK